MELNFRTMLIGCLFNFIRIQITGALFFGISSNINRVVNNKRLKEKSHSPYMFHHPSQRQFASEDLGNYAKRKRFYEFNPVAFRSNHGGSRDGRNTKRFFHFSPFITSFDSDRKSWTPKSKPKHEQHKTFVDHFTGLLPSTLHTSNKKFTNEDSTNNGFRRTGFINENNDFGRDYMNGAIKQLSAVPDTSFENFNEPLPFEFNPDILEDGEYDTGLRMQITTPTYNSKPLDSNPFVLLKEKLASDSNTQKGEMHAINPFEEPSSDLDDDFDTYGLEWLSDKITSHADTNTVSSDNMFHQLESNKDSKQHGDSEFPFINVDHPYNQNHGSPFSQNNAYFKQPNANEDQIGFGTIELRNHDSIHSGFDKFGDIPVLSEFVNPSNKQTKLTGSNGHLPESFGQTFGDYNDIGVDESIPHLNSWTDEEIKPHVGVGSFVSDNAHCVDIDTRECSGDLDCSCYGMYTCSDMRCLSFESLLSGTHLPADISEDSGQWFDTPFDSWTK